MVEEVASQGELPDKVGSRIALNVLLAPFTIPHHKGFKVIVGMINSKLVMSNILNPWLECLSNSKRITICPATARSAEISATRWTFVANAVSAQR